MKRFLIASLIGILMSSPVLSVYAQQRSTITTVTLNVGQANIPSNTLKMIVLSHFIYANAEGNEHISQVVTGNNGVFTFHIDSIKELSYFVIKVPGDSSLKNEGKLGDFGYLEPGDNINMTLIRAVKTSPVITDYTFTYSGPGASKLTCLQKMNRVFYEVGGGAALVDSSLRLNPGFVITRKRQAALNVLTAYKDSVSQHAYELMLVDAQAKSAHTAYSIIRKKWKVTQAPHDRQKLRQAFDTLAKLLQPGPSWAKEMSVSFGSSFLEMAVADIQMSDTAFSFEKLYNGIKQHSPGIRARAIINFINLYSMVLPNLDSLLKDAHATVTQEPFKSMVTRYFNNRSGAPVYPFKLPDESGNIVSIENFKGKVVFIDWWFTGCTACAMFYQQHLKAAQQYFKNDTNVVFLSVSVDKAPSLWKKSLLSGKYTGPEAINLYTDGLGGNHPVLKYYNFTGYPRKMIIDPQGRLSPFNDYLLSNSNKIVAAVNRLLPRTTKSNSNRPTNQNQGEDR